MNAELKTNEEPRMNLLGKTVLTSLVYLLSCNFLHAQESQPDSE